MCNLAQVCWKLAFLSFEVPGSAGGMLDHNRAFVMWIGAPYWQHGPSGFLCLYLVPPLLGKTRVCL